MCCISVMRHKYVSVAVVVVVIVFVIMHVWCVPQFIANVFVNKKKKYKNKNVSFFVCFLEDWRHIINIHWHTHTHTHTYTIVGSHSQSVTPFTTRSSVYICMYVCMYVCTFKYLVCFKDTRYKYKTVLLKWSPILGSHSFKQRF